MIAEHRAEDPKVRAAILYRTNAQSRVFEEAMRRAQALTLACDVFVAIGSSLVVYPAAAFPVMAKRNGATLAIVNREPTEIDGIADLVVHGEIGEVLGPLLSPGGDTPA